MIEPSIDEGDVIREFFKRWPRLYYTIMFVFGPTLLTHLSAHKFLHRFQRSGLTLNVGSGPYILAAGVTNVDITQYKGVDVIADAERLPFPDSSVARVVYNTVLEHVENSEAVLEEARRVLETGGYAYLSVPFMYPFHSSPSDYLRWTDLGIKTACARHGLQVIEKGVRAGPFSVIVLWLAYFFASLLCFGNKKLYWTLVNIFLILLFWIKVFDFAASYLPFAENFSSIIYVVAQKS